MATRTISAAGGTRAWSSTATWNEGVVPTAADDVVSIAAGLSGALTIDAGAVCRSFDHSNGGGAITHNSGVTLTIGDATAGAGNVAFQLDTGDTYTLGSATTSAIAFVSTSTTAQSVGFAAKTTGNITYNGAGGSWLLVGTHNTGATATVTLTQGTLDTNGRICSWGKFDSSGALTRTLTLGTSAIAITGSATPWTCQTSTNLTLNANTSTITMSGASVTFHSGGKVYNNLVQSGSGTPFVRGSPTIANYTRTGTAAKTDGLGLGASSVLTVTGTLALNAVDAVNRLFVGTDVLGSAATINAAVFTATGEIDFVDITAAGAATWTAGASGATYLGDGLGNSGITFTVAATQTHTASAGGNWSDATKWTSRVPLPQDNVVVDGNTTDTLTADMPRLGKDLTFTGFTGVMAWGTIANSVFGSVTLSSGMGTMTGTSTTTLAGRGSHTLTSAGKTFSQALTQNGPTGTYTLVDALLTTAALTVTGGTFDAVSFNVTALTFTMGNALGTINMGTGTWTITQTTAVTVWSVTAGTVTASTSTIVISAASANTRTFAGGGKTYGTLTYTVAGSTGQLSVTGSNTFATINFSDVTNARTLQFTNLTTTTITTSFNGVVGTAGKLMTIQSSSAGSPFTLTKSSGTVSCDYLSIKDSAATVASWYAGANSTDVSGNSGWIFTVPQVLVASRLLLGVG